MFLLTINFSTIIGINEINIANPFKYEVFANTSISASLITKLCEIGQKNTAISGSSYNLKPLSLARLIIYFFIWVQYSRALSASSLVTVEN